MIAQKICWKKEKKYVYEAVELNIVKQRRAAKVAMK